MTRKYDAAVGRFDVFPRGDVESRHPAMRRAGLMSARTALFVEADDSPATSAAFYFRDATKEESR